jgi:hypothetical protein
MYREAREGVRGDNDRDTHRLHRHTPSVGMSRRAPELTDDVMIPGGRVNNTRVDLFDGIGSPRVRRGDLTCGPRLPGASPDP